MNIFWTIRKALPRRCYPTARAVLVALVIVLVSHYSHAIELEISALASPVPLKIRMVSVYAAMSLDSRVVDVIDRETVQIHYEIMGSDQAWCGVGRQLGTTLLGFVPCGQLAGGIITGEEWQLVDPGPGSKKTTGHKQQAAINQNQVTVSVLITRKQETAPASLVLDTGASISVVSREVAERLALDLTSAKKIILHGLGGSAVEAWLVLVDSLSIGPCVKNEMRIAVIDQQVLDGRQDGLLGMDFLQDFTYHIDFASQTVEWGVRR